MHTKNWFLMLYFYCMCLEAVRNAHRPRNPAIPHILVWQEDKKKVYNFIDPHLRNLPLHAFDEKHVKDNQIPSIIHFRYSPEQCTTKKTIKKLIENLLQEIKSINHKTQVAFKDFIILKKLDFNFVTKTGFMVLKFKNYPFVLKLFIENAKTISHPYTKNFQERGLFIMGGCLRHFGGFTRVKNAQLTVKKLMNSKWENKVTLPRKWYYLPDNPQWITIKTFNLSEQEEHITFPGIYAILCDLINLNSSRPADETCLELASYLEYSIDPHAINFLMEQGTSKIAIIDTEHFPTLIGSTEKIELVTSYTQWYFNLTKHYVSNKFFYLKDERIRRQKNNKSYYEQEFIN